MILEIIEGCRIFFSKEIAFKFAISKDKIAKFPHPTEPVGPHGFVPGVEAHIDLVQKGGLKVGYFRILVDPRGLNRCLGGRDGQGVGISADFLQRGQDQDLFLGPAFEAVLEAPGDGRDGASEAGGHQFGGGCVRMGHQDGHVLRYRIGAAGGFGQEFGKFLDLVQSKGGRRGVVKPTAVSHRIASSL